MRIEPKILDLFAGCGGFSLGAHFASFPPVLAVDVDRILSSSYRINFPATRHLLADLAAVDLVPLVKDVLEGDRLAGVIGGPPCQGFSEIGPRRSDDPRNELVWHFFRNVVALRPRFFVMENVRGLGYQNRREALEAALELVAAHYAILGPFMVDAADYGAPTRRKRLIVVGYDPQEADAPRLPVEPPSGPGATVRSAIGDLAGTSAAGTCERAFDWWKYAELHSPSAYARSCRELPSERLGASWAIQKLRRGKISGMRRTRHSPAVEARFANVLPGETDPVGRHPRLEWEGLCTALRAGTGPDKGSYQSVRPVHPEEHRVITVREAARLQGFPDWFQFHPTIWHSFRMIGNSVAPPLAAGIMRAMFECCLGCDRVPASHPILDVVRGARREEGGSADARGPQRAHAGRQAKEYVA